MSNFLDLNQLKDLLPKPDVTVSPPPQTVTVPPSPIDPTPSPTPMPMPTIPPPEPITQQPAPQQPIVINVPPPTTERPPRREDDYYPRSPYWSGRRYTYPQYPQLVGSEVDNSIKTGNISNTWGTNNNNDSSVQTIRPSPQPVQPQIIVPPATPRPIRQKKEGEGMSMMTKVVLGLCALIILGGAGYLGWMYFKRKNKGNKGNKGNANKGNTKNNTNNNSFMNNFNNNMSNNSNNSNNNNTGLPKPPSS